MDKESAIKYLKSFPLAYGGNETIYDDRDFDLERIREFAKKMGVKYEKLKYIHVAGSKGKGSVCTMIAGYLSSADYKTGLFTSPYIFDVCESFWINGENISDDEFSMRMGKLKDFVDDNGSGGLTYFEILTVMVLQYFIDEGVEYAVFEVGLGGRLDATNIVTPEVSVLCRVEKEHTDVLGDTLSEILDEKLGIVKEGVPLVIGYQSSEVRELIESKLKNKSDLFWVEEEYGDFENVVQAKNAAVAKKSLEVLLGNVDEEIFTGIMENFHMIGRFDVRNVNGKTVVFDIAHSVSSIRNLIKSLRKKFPDKEFVFLVSLMKGKNVEEILEMIDKVTDRVILCSSNKERGFTGAELAEFLDGAEVVEDPTEAYTKVLNGLKKTQILVITGSHFLFKEILERA